MRILVNGLSARLGGGQTYLRNLLAYAPPKWKIFVLCTNTFDFSSLPRNVERVPIDSDLNNPFYRVLWEQMHLSALAKKLETDVLFAPGGLLPCFLPTK